MQQLLIKTFLFPVLIVLFISPLAFAGGDNISEKDLQLLRRHADHKDTEHKHHSSGTEFLRPQGENTLSRFNPVTLSLGGLMFVYQRWISPQLPSECLYHTSCSAFSKNLIVEYGLVKGILATSDRLMRCNRVAALDVHPMHIHPVSGRVDEDTGIYRRP